MSLANLLDLDIDKLFEQHGVPEIAIVHKKIQAVVENKREELRTMVGERYRDLLKAADTIVEMQDSSSSLITEVKCITDNCRSLNEHQLIGFKTDETTELLRMRSANKQQNNYFSAMIQIKLLTSLPELIWKHLDKKCFQIATELFIFGRHVSTGLQLDTNDSLKNLQPVVKRQWDMLKPFHSTIKQLVTAELEREELSTTVTLDCLLSLFLLEKSTLSEVLKMLLQLRSAAYSKILMSSSDEENINRRIKERILASLKVLYETLELISSCFLEDGLLFQRLTERMDPTSLPSVDYMGANHTEFMHMLPEIISKFRPKFDEVTSDDMLMRDLIEEWLADISCIVDTKLRQLFDMVSTISNLQEIKSKMHSLQREFKFSALTEACKLSEISLNFYESKYLPLVAERIRDIICDSWQQAMDETFCALERSLEPVLQVEKAVRDLAGQLLWENISEDLPQSLAEALSEDLKTKKILMKMKGYNGEIVSICNVFDSHMAAIVTELKVLLGEETVKDKKSLLDFLRNTSQQKINDLITKVKGLNLKKNQRQALVQVVRLLGALTELCPNAKLCFCPQNDWWQQIDCSPYNVSDDWQRICQLMDDEIMVFWLQIIEGILEENPCEKFLPKEIGLGTILADFVNWETVTLDQKDEQDNPLQTNFRIPSQPRISLQSYLFNIIRSIIASIPQALPLSVSDIFNERLLMHILLHYESLTPTSQNVALQLYFDLKFLSKLFAVSRDSRELYKKIQAVINKYKESIDPFDFELLEEHLSANIKRSACRLSCLLGVLVPKTAAENANSGSSSVSLERDPNILALSSSGSTSLWFPLLPIVEPSSSNSTGANQRTPTERKAPLTEASDKPSSNQKSSPSKRKNDGTKSKSGAAYFFGAMSQDWFR